MPRQMSHRGRAVVYALITLAGVLLLPVTVAAQGNGRSSTGTGGAHTLQGYIFFPSGRRAEGQIVVRLQSYNSGELTVIPDSSGAFVFTNLAPGNYTVVVNAGDDYEIARESVYFDSDVNMARIGGERVPQSPQRATVMIHLQLKPSARNKPGVVNAALAEVPDKAHKLFDKGMEEANAGNAAKAVESLKEAVTLYPDFPLALNELGVQYLKLGQTTKAVDALRSAVRLSPDAYGPRLNLGIALLEAKQYEEAELQLHEALKRNAALATAHMYLGLCFLHTKKFEEAESELLLAIKDSGNQLGMAQYYLGGIYWKKREYPKAIAALEDYLRLTPNAHDAARVRATIQDLRTRTP